MSWLRLDDGFTSNAKIAQLTDGEFRVWMRLLCHCARSGDPSVDPVARREVKGLTAKKVQKFASLLLLDMVANTYEIHDWICYQPKDKTGAERQAKWRARQAGKPNGHVTPTVTPAVTKPSLARAQPVPSRPEVTTTAEDKAAVERLKQAGWSHSQFVFVEGDLERAVAWLDHAESDPTCKSVGALSWSMFKQGGWPEAAVPTIAAGAQGTRSTAKKVTYTCEECAAVFDTYLAREEHVDATHFEPAAPPTQRLSA